MTHVFIDGIYVATSYDSAEFTIPIPGTLYGDRELQILSLTSMYHLLTIMWGGLGQQFIFLSGLPLIQQISYNVHLFCPV